MAVLAGAVVLVLGGCGASRPSENAGPGAPAIEGSEVTGRTVGGSDGDTTDRSVGAGTPAEPSEEPAGSQSSEEESPASSAPATAAPSTAPPPEEPAENPPEERPASDPSGDEEDVDPEFEVRLDELIAFVEQERGHEFVTRPVVDRYVGAEFVAAYDAILERDAVEYREDWQDGTDLYRALGVIDGSRSLESIFTSFADAGVLGFYDSESGRIVLRGDELDPMVETTLVHELVHALDDQIFDIDRPEYDDRDDEIAWAFSALLEGNATEIENRFRAGFTPSQIEAERQARRELSRGTSLSSFSDSFIDLQFSRYLHGFDLVSELWDDGRAAVDDALVDPPGTSEEVIDAELYLSGAGPDPNPVPPVADGEVFADGVFGQVAWKAILLDAVDFDTATRAAAGWGGDWYVAWRTGDRACVRVHVAADTPDDLDELANALERWVSAGADRSVFYPTADLIRVTACG